MAARSINLFWRKSDTKNEFQNRNLMFRGTNNLWGIKCKKMIEGIRNLFKS